MTERDRASLLDIARFAETILQLTAGMDEAAFQADVRTQLAVLYELTVLGEAVKRLSQEFRDRHPDIPWRNMAGMRDKLIHDYDRVDARRVWEVVTTSLPDLLNKIDPLLPKEGNA
ncbi:MAG: DUF86 domain-containing protein [Leptolyngbyaceae cyanobacterium SL_5_9]|nr:DUF86 domain-containing protein [Leptolyngbyaceae cyanobacterium SL_5_9]NJO72807.1 DUF86 domain-containing protein [Leptolyngbyaceae cyanobacterium RM1_406_9]